jgi:excisionase family DNA binding protein
MGEFKLTMTVDEVAWELHIGRSTVFKLIKEDGLPAVKVGKRRLIFRGELEGWLKDRASEED